MLFTIDNFDGFGARDYTSSLTGDTPLQVRRRLNQTAHLTAILVANNSQFVVPASGGRVLVTRADGSKVFTGYLVSAPSFEYLGWGPGGPVYRYLVEAEGDELLLDRKVLPARAPMTSRTAGNALKQIATDVQPGVFNTAGVQDIVTVPTFFIDVQHPWSHHAAELGLSARASYRAHDGALIFSPVGSTVHAINESAADFSPDGLELSSPNRLINDLTLAGAVEPAAHVKNYFLGDGLTVLFNLSHKPFTRFNHAFVDEEYKSAPLNPAIWALLDPTSAISISGGALQVAGGAGTDGATTVSFVELLEMGAALQLQHGEMTFSAASTGVLGGLYNGSVSTANCFAGFQVTPSGGQSSIQALVNGTATGAVITTAANHRYRLTTRIYATEMFRQQNTFFSSTHPAGGGRGGAAIASNARIVLEVHDIDSVFFTRLGQISEAEVRSAIPVQAYRTRLVGAIEDGSECIITSHPALEFYSQYVPVANEAIAVRYRSWRRALARITDQGSIASLARAGDDGVRGAVRSVHLPSPRTQSECELATLALLDDATQPAWTGEYDVWSDFLPGGPAADVFPGDSVAVNVPSRSANFNAIVREVDITVDDPANDRTRLKILFSNDAAVPLAFDPHGPHLKQHQLPDVTATTTTSSTEFIADLALAEVTSITSTTVSMDAGTAPPAGGGIEVRLSDSGWGQQVDHNLVGRFTTQTFSVARLTRKVTYYVQQYDNSSPPKYSRYSTALHVDYPA